MSNNSTIHSLIIIGSGPAGLTAALYASRAHLSPLVIEGPMPGGQLLRTSVVENWPGIPSILGPDLIMSLKNHAATWGARFLSQSVTKIIPQDSYFSLQTDNGATFVTKSLIIATGAKPNLLHCPGEDTYWGKGITTCAVCDGVFYKDKKVMLVGGGDTAMENASFLKKFTNDITLIQNSKALTASYVMQQRIINDPSITIMYNSTVSEIKGDNNWVTHAVITNTLTNIPQELPVNGIFICIGTKPNTDIASQLVTVDERGYICAHEDTSITSLPGVFVAGDVHDYKYKQAITASASGCKAALDAQRYLESIK